jgi:hypothetical protein
MAKRKSKARRARKAKIQVINLKTRAKTPAKLKAVLQKASKSSIGFVVLNAPFKLRRAPVAA